MVANLNQMVPTSPAFIVDSWEGVSNSEKVQPNKEDLFGARQSIRKTKTLANINLKVIKGVNLYTGKLRDIKIIKERPQQLLTIQEDTADTFT